ncbi:MAG: hypothetical protein ACYC3H_01605 [Bellilinea sp.]
MNEPAKIWRCKNGHHMGQVIRNGSGIRVLLLYRQALDLNDEGKDLEEVEVMGIVEGYVAEIRCSICGSIRSWVPGAEAMRILIDKHRNISDK